MAPCSHHPTPRPTLSELRSIYMLQSFDECPIKFASEAKLVGDNAVRIFHHHARVISSGLLLSLPTLLLDLCFF